MELLIVRHAHAGDDAYKKKWARSGRPDTERPLSDKGRRTMKKAAKGLRKVHREIDLLVSSAHTRAAQTAEILALTYGSAGRLEIRELAPDSPPEALLKWLRQRREKSIAVVGHEPHLSRFVGYALAGTARSLVRLKKGHACLVGFGRTIAARSGILLWSLTPRQLRRVAGE